MCRKITEWSWNQMPLSRLNCKEGWWEPQTPRGRRSRLKDLKPRRRGRMMFRLWKCRRMRRCGREEELYGGALEINGACQEIPNSIFFANCRNSYNYSLRLGFFCGFYLHACSKVRYEYSLVIYTSSLVSLCFSKGRIRSVRWRRRHPTLPTHVLNHVSTMLRNFTYPSLLTPHHSHALCTPTIPDFPIITTSSPLKSVVPPKDLHQTLL
jgi:hypothetical protein